MSGPALGVFAVAGAGGVMLLAAGLRHLAGRRALVATIRRQRLLPGAPVVAAALVTAELAVGSGVLALVVLVRDAPGFGAAWLAFAAESALYLAFATYLTVLLLLRPGSECGCGYAGDGPARPWRVWLATAFAAAGGLAALPPVLAPAAAAPVPARLFAAGIAAGTVVSVALLGQAWRPPVAAPLRRVPVGRV